MAYQSKYMQNKLSGSGQENNSLEYENNVPAFQIPDFNPAQDVIGRAEFYKPRPMQAQKTVEEYPLSKLKVIPSAPQTDTGLQDFSSANALQSAVQKKQQQEQIALAAAREAAKNGSLEKWISPDYRMTSSEQIAAKELVKEYLATENPLVRMAQRTGGPGMHAMQQMTGEQRKEYARMMALKNKTSDTAAFAQSFLSAMPLYDTAMGKMSEMHPFANDDGLTYEQRRQGTTLQNPVASGAGTMAGKMTEYAAGSALMRTIPGVNALVQKAGTALGGTKAAQALAKAPIVGGAFTANGLANIIGDQTLDVALDTLPEAIQGAQQGKGAGQIAGQAAKNFGTNLAFNLGGEALSSTIKSVGDMKAKKSLSQLPESGLQLSGVEALKYPSYSIPNSSKNARPRIENRSTFGANTVGAAERNPNSYSALQNEYGTIKPGENPARVVDVPLKTSKTEKVRHYTRTAMEAEATPDELVKRFEEGVADGLFSYKTKTDKDALRSATRTVTEKGYNGALKQWADVVDGYRKANKDDIALAQMLYAEAAKAGDMDIAMKLGAEIAAEGTRLGQDVQAFRLLKKMTPEGQLYYIQKTVENLNRDIESGVRKGVKNQVKLNSTLANQLVNAKTPQEIEKISADILKDVADQLPSTWADKWNAWRYLSMLGNPRTHVRNIVGNAVFYPARKIKDATKYTLESLIVDKNARTAAVLNPLSKADSALKDFAKTDFSAMESVITGTGKLNPSDIIKQNQTVFNNKLLESTRKFNDAALNAEDSFFLKNAYTDSMAGFMKARGLQAKDMKGRALEQARSYAINQAQKATYRDASALANALNEFKEKNTFTKIVGGGAMPFTKTPINVLKRGIEYNPVGLVKSLTYDLAMVKNGTKTVSEALEDISSGLTGTGIIALGAFLASQGVLSAGASENKKEAGFNDLTGAQEYAIKIGNGSYTIDWASPVALPLFVGAEIANQFNRESEGFNFARIADALTAVSEPMINMSMLQGINNAIKTAGYSEQPVTDIAMDWMSGYVAQGVPTLLGQVARSVDPVRRTTYVEKDSALPRSFDKALQKTKNKVPGLSQLSQPYIDQWGRAQENTGGSVLGRMAYNMLSPGYYSENKATKTDYVLEQLYKKTGETSVLPGYASKSATVDGQKTNFSAQQYTQFATERGQTSYNILEQLTPKYKNFTNEQAVKATEKTYSIANELAKLSVLDAPVSDSTQQILDYAEKQGGNRYEAMANAIYARQLMLDIESDKYPNGKVKQGSGKRKKMQALQDAGWEYREALEMYDLFN